MGAGWAPPAGRATVWRLWPSAAVSGVHGSHSVKSVGPPQTSSTTSPFRPPAQKSSTAHHDTPIPRIDVAHNATQRTATRHSSRRPTSASKGRFCARDIQMVYQLREQECGHITGFLCGTK